MNPHIKRAAILIVGWGFILLGIVGLFLPVLQGVLFILVGLTILSTEYAWAHRWLTKLRDRFPKVSAAADHAWTKLRQRCKRLFSHRP
jgi:uncharacterized protein